MDPLSLCMKCQGTGIRVDPVLLIRLPCPFCDGRGYEPKEELNENIQNTKRNGASVS
jgi:DnaJ-class molecular chaperone